MIKIELTSTLNENHIHPNLQNFALENINKLWLASDSYIVSIDVKNIMTIFNIYNKHIMFHTSSVDFYFTNILCEFVIYRTINTFQQNDLQIANELYSFINNQIINSCNKIFIGIGGEFYLYFIFNKHKFTNFYGYTNNENIIKLAQRNCALHSIKVNLQLMNYNIQQSFINFSSTLLINMSTIPLQLLMAIVSSKPIQLIIITCNLLKYNQRRHIIEKYYKLKNFNHIQSTITLSIVSVFIYKNKC